MKKGFSLVEVLVALSIFVISFVVILSTYLLATKGYQKEKEYLYFESICYDIDYYYDNQSDWSTYFGSGYENDFGKVFYDSDFKIVDEINAKYELSYKLINNELHVSIFNLEQEYFVIEDLNYGGGYNG